MEDPIYSKMESRNCSIPAPKLFSDIMHYSHIASFPVYLVTLIILFRETSKIFRTYKWFIIVHVIMLKAVMILRVKHFFPRFAKWQLNFYRFTIILHPIIATVTFPPNVIDQEKERIRVFKAHATFPPEITCYTVIVPVLDNVVFWIVITLYCCQVVVSVTASVGPLLYIVKFIKKGLVLSKETMKLQKILVISLFIQGAIHSIFIITPTFFQLYAIFFELHTTEIAQFLLLCIAYHGFLSTCAMIIFTKPLRDKFFFCLKWKNRTADAILQQSSNRFSSTVPASNAM